MLILLLKRQVLSFYNGMRWLTSWERGRNTGFLLLGIAILYGLYATFWRLLHYLDAVSVIGTLLIWKLTAMALLTTFSMVVISSLVTSLTTLFYSYDLPFLVKAPLPFRTVFIEKSIEATVYSSWVIGVATMPYIVALTQVEHLSVLFLTASAALMVPFFLIAATIGMAFTMGLMRLFPSPRTRDAIWILSSFSIAIVYVLMRFAEPEKLVRPDFMQIMAQYLNYLQAPTAKYLPSWWLTRAMWGYVYGRWDVFAGYGGLLIGVAASFYGVLVFAAGITYSQSYSGAQEGRRSGRKQSVQRSAESIVLARLRAPIELSALFWKERISFFRDVNHWSQIILVAALLCVYLFSIHRIPLDQFDVKNVVSFLNLLVAGFVVSSLGLRFTFPAMSLEGKSFWVLRAAPIRIGRVMMQKFLFTVVPTLVLSILLVLVSNRFLQADRFFSWLSLSTVCVMAVALCSMGVGFGCIFPKFNVPNIHQIESSAGGFVYMAACMGYVVATVALEAIPVTMYFQGRFKTISPWLYYEVVLCAGSLAVLNVVALTVPWFIGKKVLEYHEEK